MEQAGVLRGVQQAYLYGQPQNYYINTKKLTMKLHEYGQADIEVVLNKVRSIKKDIGAYQQHSFTDYGDYMVRLTNGSIRIYPEELEYGNALFYERLKDISFRFRDNVK